ncbi:MAG: hypothetical protein V3W43_12980 [Desulfatiglandaceae bacterium]
MLEIRPIMNSSVEEIFAFKGCCGIRSIDQNLEIQLKNVGDRPVVVLSYFVLKGRSGSERIETLMPHGEQRIEPGDIKAFYCTMDDKQWGAAEELVFYDCGHNEYPVKLHESQ